MSKNQKEVGGKTQRHAAINKLIADVVDIDSDSELTTPKKNILHKNAAARFVTALRDKRKPLEKQIKPNTLKRYITDARKAITEKQWFHSSFQNKIALLLRNYPLFGDEITAIRDAGINKDKPLDAVRLKRKEIDTKMNDAGDLLSKLSNIDVVAVGWKKKVADLVKQDMSHEKVHSEDHGFWSDELNALIKSDNPKKDIDALCKKMEVATDNTLYERIKGLKIDHEVMRHLVLPTFDKSTIRSKDEKAVSAKHSNVQEVDYIEYMSTVNALLSVKEWVPEYYQALTIGIIMVTGRRPIEVLYQGKFKKTGEYTLEFSGQAKRRGGVDYSDKHHIYSLVPSSEVISAIENLRATAKVKEFAGLKPTNNLSINQQITNRTSLQLNTFMDNLVERNNWPPMDAKHGRALYAKICTILFHRTDPRWAKYSEEKMVSILLGHEDDNAQKFYRNWHVKNAGKDYPIVEYPERGTIIEELDKLDNVMREADKTKEGSPMGARAKLHEKIKVVLRKDPDTEITNRFIRNTPGLGGNPLTIKHYLELAETALQNDFDLVKFIGKKVGTIQDAGGNEIQPAKKMAHGQPVVEKEQEIIKQQNPTKKAFPKLNFKDQGDGDWLVTVTENEVVSEYRVEAESLCEAGEKAWAEHTNPTPDDTYLVDIYFAKGALIPVIEIEVEAKNVDLAKIEAKRQIRQGGIETPIKKIDVKLKR